MDPSWRIRKRNGKGASRLLIGFPQRSAAIGKLGLRAGLRRFGGDLPYGGLLGLVILCAVSVIGVSIFGEAVDSDSDLRVSYLDSVAPVEDEIHRRVAVPDKESPAITPPREENRSRVRTPARVEKIQKWPTPQIDALAATNLPEPRAELAERVRAISRRPMPIQLSAVGVKLPSVAATGPRADRAFGQRARATKRIGPPRPALLARDDLSSDEPATRVSRQVAVVAPGIAARRAPTQNKHLQGVPLGSLASCISPAREDALKRRVVARVHEPTRCQSRSGTYRFVETKNLNALLMWVERAGDRETGDRCSEISLALDCLSEGVIKKGTEKS